MKLLLTAILFAVTLPSLADDDRHHLFRPQTFHNLPEMGSPSPFQHDWLATVPSECVQRKDLSEQCKKKWSHRIEIKEAKRLMPELFGLRAERVTIRRNGVYLNYSW